MSKSVMNPKTDFYFNKPKKWQKEIGKLRTIVLECGLKEELKWGCPCYTHNESNIVLIHVFKDYCALLFFKGALMKDDEKILVQQTKNVQAARQIRFISMEEITELKPIIKSYIKEAIRIEKAGLKVTLKKTEEYKIPDELKNILGENSAFKKAFYSLTPGRQRGYILFFSAPKQSKTREARVEKFMDKIMNGEGLHD